MYACVSPRRLLALTVAVALVAGPATSSSAALADWWPFGAKKPAEAIPDPVPYSVTLTAPDADARLTKALRKASGLIDRQTTPASGLAGLIARARQDVAQLTAVLYENARYGAQITVTIDCRPLATVGPFDTIATRPVPVVVQVTAGPAFVFGRVTSGTLPPGISLDKLGLAPGKPAGSATILAAETAIAEAWRQQGHPLVVIGRRDTIADHRTRTLDVALAIDPGPAAAFGRVSVTGTAAVSADLVLRRAGIGGGLYSSTVTRRAEDRLRDLGVFDSVRVTPGAALDADGTIPITIAVSESKRHVIGGSITYSNTEGLGLETHWRDRNVFGGAEQLEVRGSVARLLNGAFDPDYDLAGTFKKPAVYDPMTDFTLRLEGYRRTTDAYRVTAAEAETELNHIFSDTLSGSVGLELARSETVDAISGIEEHLPLTLTGKLDWDGRDNKFDPTSGFRAQFMAAPSYDFLVKQPSATFSTDLSAYRPFGEGDRFVLAGRVAASVLTVDDLTTVAADRRLYAGGAGSVRGYAYQNLGPRDASGNALGGRSALLLSGELRYRINDQFGVVGFVDAGNAYASMVPFGDLRVGVGAGLRYLTPVGPLRLDVAVPLQPRSGDPAVAIYVGLGQAF